MAKVFTTVKGARVVIGPDDRGVRYVATDDGVEVPEDVATQIENEIRGERPNPNFGKFRDKRDAKFYESRQAATDADVPEESVEEETERVHRYATRCTNLRVEREPVSRLTRPPRPEPQPTPKPEEK